MKKAIAPLHGFNTNLRYRGRVFHVQTEDSGRQFPHVITHIFADGGRVIATRKTGYGDRIEEPDCSTHVRDIMILQHKTMCNDLKNGLFDADAGITPGSEGTGQSMVKSAPDMAQEREPRPSEATSKAATNSMKSGDAVAPAMRKMAGSSSSHAPSLNVATCSLEELALYYAEKRVAQRGDSN